MKASSRRIVMYTEARARGGAEVSLRNLIAALDGALDVTVMGPDATTCSWIASARPGTAVAPVRPVRTKGSVLAFLALRRDIVRLSADVFHANLRTITDAQYALLAAVTVRGLKVVAVEQLPFPPATRLSTWLKRVTSARLAAHVAVGKRAARLVEEMAGLPTGRILTIYNGVPDLGPSPPARNSRVTLGTLARLDRIKGLDVLLDAATSLADTTLLLVGEGPERATLGAQAARLGIASRVRFLPWSDNAREIFDEIDIFVLPSRNEGFPLAIVEAMLAARPVVATDVGSVREAVEHGKTGLVVAVDDVLALREGIARLARDPDLRQQMGEAGRTRALGRFTAAAMAREFERLYERVDPR
jgi:glycosyltransferase involved in cell wall biosynthesis